MEAIGLHNVQKQKYSFERVTGMIDRGCPLIIYSLPNANIFKSHCWNIDGYKIKERTITIKRYTGDRVETITVKKEVCNMVHCDFGWGGQCNGYYVSGVFKLNDPNIEHDYYRDSGQSTNYNTFTKIITYNRP